MIYKKLVHIYELPTNLQNFTQKDLTEVKIFQKVLGEGATFFETPGIKCHSQFRIQAHVVQTVADDWQWQ